MPAPDHHVRPLVAALVAALLFASPAWGGARQARKLYQQGRGAELAGEYDKALELYARAGREKPGDVRYDLAERRLRFVAGQAHVDAGLQLRAQGLLQEALAEFQRAVEIDPASSVAAQELSRTLAIAERSAGAGPGAQEPGMQPSPLEAERFGRAERLGSLVEPPTLAPLSNEPINLMLNEQARVVFETVGKLAGINMLFDPDFADRRVEIEIQNATLAEALDYVSLLTKAYWKPVTHNAVMVTDDNPNKRREYEDWVVKTVYLTNLATPQDLTEVTTAIRGLTTIRRIFPVNSMNAIVMRGTIADIAIAEKIVHDMDKPRPEVIVDVLVMETSRSNERTLGLTPVSGGSKGLQGQLSFTGLGAGEGTAVPINRLGSVGSGSWSLSLPNYLVTAVFKGSDTDLLQSPRVRAADNQQAVLRIGDKIPIATGSFQPGVGGVGISPLVNTQFTYTDVGVNVILTPKVHPNRDVSMHVEIEISNVSEFVDIGGITQPVIGQRTIQHDVRVREGEASIIGGLNQTEVFVTRAGVPFLSDIPILGRLFHDEEVKRSNSELLLVLVPHIVRMPGIESANLRTIATGTETSVKLRYERPGNGKPALPPLPDETEAAEAPEPALGAPPAAPASPPGPDEPTPASTSAPEDRPTGPEQAAERPAAGPGLFLDLEGRAVGVGAEETFAVRVRNAVQLVSLPLRIQYDREKLRLVQVAKGPFLEGEDASDIIFSRSIRHSNGLAAVNISRFPGAGGADGSGALVMLTFEGLAPGAAQVRIAPTGPRDAANEAVPVEPLEVEITVQ